MTELLQDPAIQAGVLPFAIALVAVVVIRFGGGRTIGARFAPLAVCFAFVAVYAVLEGAPPFPPVASKQKLAYLAAIAIVLGFLLDAFRAETTAVRAVAAFFPLGAVLWLAERQLFGSPSVDFILLLLALWLAAVLSLWLLEFAARTEHLRIDDAAEKGGLDAPTVMMVAAFAGGAVSLFGAFIGLAQLSVAIGAALGAFMLVNYLLYVISGRSLKFGAIGVVGIGGTWFAGVYVMTLFGGNVSKAALAILSLVFIADLFARHVRVGSGLGGRILLPVIYGAIVTLPALVAVGLAYVMRTPDPGY